MPESEVNLPVARQLKPESKEVTICPEVLRATSRVPSLLDFKTSACRQSLDPELKEVVKEVLGLIQTVPAACAAFIGRNRVATSAVTMVQEILFTFSSPDM